MMMCFSVQDNNKNNDGSRVAGQYIYVRLQWPDVTPYWVYNNQIIGKDRKNYLSGGEII